MTDAIAVLISFVLGCVVTFFFVRKTIGERKWREGYLHGFNFAWDEKAKVDEKIVTDRMKKLRRSGPKLLVIKGDKG